MPLRNGSSTGCTIYKELPQLLNNKREFALATVVDTQGSSPQKKGNSALFGIHGLETGTIGGGIVEFSVQQKAREALLLKRSARHVFSLTNDINETNAAICGGKMEILLDADPVKHLSVFNAIKESLLQGAPGVLITFFAANPTGDCTIQRKWITREEQNQGLLTLAPELTETISDMLINPVMGDFRQIFFPAQSTETYHAAYLETLVPAPKLVIAGAGHVGKALSHLGKILGFEVIVWDARSEYATKENLPDADILLNGKPNDSLAAVPVNKNTYIVIVTNGHASDAEVLKTFLNSPAGYLGMIGSKKKTVLMREQFLKEGWATAEQWEKIYSPIGLDIHSETVEEIAVSIAAQLIQVKHQLNQRS